MELNRLGDLGVAALCRGLAAHRRWGRQCGLVPPCRPAPPRSALPGGALPTSAAAAASTASASRAITAIAYSPRGSREQAPGSAAFGQDEVVAVGGPDGSIELLRVAEHYTRLHTCQGHSSPVLHMDWSADGRYLQSCCGRCELLFWDALSGERVFDVGALRDVHWATFTCPLGLPVQGIYPKMSDGSDITAAHRSPDGKLLVTADDFRKVNLFTYPCGPGSAPCRSAAAHAAHVASVRFTMDGKHVISVGGPDLSVMVWRLA